MTFEKEGFISPPLDNDVQYFVLLEGIINSVDVNAVGRIIKTPSGYHFRISISDVELINSLITSINELNSFVKIHIIWSKSAKKNGTLSFFIPNLAS